MRHHTDWLRARLSTIPAVRTPANGVPASFAKVFVTQAVYPRPHEAVPVTAPYIVLHPATGVAERTRSAGGVRQKNPRWTIHAIGSTAEQAAWLGDAIEAELIPRGVPVRPVFAGENAHPFWWSSPTPIDIDRDPTPPVFLHISECGFATEITDPTGGA